MLVYSIQLLLCTIHIFRWLDPGLVPARYITEDFLAIHCLVNVLQPVLIKWSGENCYHRWALSMCFVSTWGFGLLSSMCCVCMHFHVVCCCLALCAAMKSWMWIILGIMKLCCLRVKIAWRVLAPTCYYFFGESKLWLVLKAGRGYLCQSSREPLWNVKRGPAGNRQLLLCKRSGLHVWGIEPDNTCCMVAICLRLYSCLLFVHWL